MHRHVFLDVSKDVTVNGALIPSGLYHGHEVWRTTKDRSRKVILEKHTKNGRLGVYGVVPFDITPLLGQAVTIRSDR